MTDDPWRELEAEQARLRPDITRVRQYGEAHPLEFACLRFVNEPAVVIEIGFTDHIDEHRVALTEIVSNPSRLRVIRAPYTATERAHVAEEILAWLRREHPGLFVSAGHGRDRVELRLKANGQAVAEQLRDRYGDLLVLTVGTKPFPPDRELLPFEPRQLQPLPRGGPDLNGVSSEIVLNADIVPSGETLEGKIVLHNSSERDVTVNGGQMIGSVVTAGTDDIVGVFTGAVPAYGLTVFMTPGQAGQFPLLVGTASVLPGPEPRLPPGHYEVVAVVHLTRNEVLVPRAPVTLT